MQNVEDVKQFIERYVFVKGNLSEGYTIVGPYADMDEAASAHDLEEGWLMTLQPPKEQA